MGGDEGHAEPIVRSRHDSSVIRLSRQGASSSSEGSLSSSAATPVSSYRFVNSGQVSLGLGHRHLEEPPEGPNPVNLTEPGRTATTSIIRRGRFPALTSKGCAEASGRTERRFSGTRCSGRFGPRATAREEPLEVSACSSLAGPTRLVCCAAGASPPRRSRNPPASGIGHPVALRGAPGRTRERARDLAFLVPPVPGTLQERGPSAPGSRRRSLRGCPDSRRRRTAVNDFESQLRHPADLEPAPSPSRAPEPPGPVPAPAPRRRGAFPTRPSSSAVAGSESGRVTADPLTVMVANVIGKDLAESAAVLERLGGLAGLAHASEAELSSSRDPEAARGTRAKCLRAGPASASAAGRGWANGFPARVTSGCTCAPVSEGCRSRSSG